MNHKKGMKRLLVTSVLTATVLSAGGLAYAKTQALPNGTIVSQDNKKYLADSQGDKYSGWFIDSNEDWYYFNESDKTMKTGWHHDDKDGYWYYLDPLDGRMKTGWQTIAGKEYFFQPIRDMGNYHFNNEQEKWLYSLNSKVPYGALYVSTTTPDGNQVNENGEKITSTSKNGWVLENGNWYYYQNNVKLSNQWISLNGVWYYLSTDGTMVSNSWYDVDGKSYYFGSDGAMYVNTTTPDGSKVDSTGVKVVVETPTQTVNNNSSSDTDTVKNGWVSENGSWHYYENGTLAKNKWLNLDGKWYYVLSDGAMVSNTWKEIGGKSYYFGSDGAMYVNTTTPDGKKVNQEGIVIDSKETKEIDYSNIFQGTFIRADGDEYEAYQNWIENGKATGYWLEISLEANEFSVTSEDGDSGHAVASGTITWTGNNTAILVDRSSQNSNNLEVIDSNTILIDNDKYIKIK